MFDNLFPKIVPFMR